MKLIFLSLTMFMIVACSGGPKIKGCSYVGNDISYENRLDAKIFYTCQRSDNKRCEMVKNRFGEVVSTNCPVN